MQYLLSLKILPYFLQLLHDSGRPISRSIEVVSKSQPGFLLLVNKTEVTDLSNSTAFVSSIRDISSALSFSVMYFVQLPALESISTVNSGSRSSAQVRTWARAVPEISCSCRRIVGFAFYSYTAKTDTTPSNFPLQINYVNKPSQSVPTVSTL